MSNIVQLTRQEAIDVYNSEKWKDWTDEEIVKFQLFQDRLCVPFAKYHKSLEKVLGRPVFTHEMGFPESLIDEYLGKKEQPTFTEILELLADMAG